MTDEYIQILYAHEQNHQLLILVITFHVIHIHGVHEAGDHVVQIQHGVREAGDHVAQIQHGVREAGDRVAPHVDEEHKIGVHHVLVQIEHKIGVHHVLI